MKTITMKELMKEAHKRAKTYIGDYQACLKLAIIELRREYTVINSNTKNTNSVTKQAEKVPYTVEIDYSRFSENLVTIIKNAIEKSKASDKKKVELLETIFNNANNDAQLVGMFIHTFEKSFMKVVTLNTHKDYVYGLDAVYSEAMVNLMTKVDNGYIIEKSIKQAFKFEVMNIVKKETRRNQKNSYTSMDEEGYTEMELHNDTTEYYGKIPVDKILREMDIENLLNEKQLEVFNLMLKGYSKTKIDEKFGQRMDRTYNAIKEIMEAYVKYEYSEKLYA